METETIPILNKNEYNDFESFNELNSLESTNNSDMVLDVHLSQTHSTKLQVGSTYENSDIFEISIIFLFYQKFLLMTFFINVFSILFLCELINL